MTTTYKVLGQVAPSANTDTDLYTVPGSTQTVASTLVICNQNATNITYRVAVRPAGAAIATKHYISYDVMLPPNSNDFLTLGLSLAATDVVTVRANTANVSFNLSGAELT